MIKIIAFTIVYNEEELIEKCLRNAREQGLIPIVIDNGCTDDTIKIVRGLRVPVFERKTEGYHVYRLIEWGILRAKEIGCDWYVLKDADEIFETYDGRKVVEVVDEADKAGYNCMRFDWYEFWPTVYDDLSIKDFTERIQHYTYYDDDHLKMIKNSKEIYTRDPHTPGGTIKESPARLLLKHYRFINLEQGRRKAKRRIAKSCLTKKRYSPYYDFAMRFGEDKDMFYVLEKDIASKLTKFNGTWNKERVFGCWRPHGALEKNIASKFNRLDGTWSKERVFDGWRG